VEKIKKRILCSIYNIFFSKKKVPCMR